MNKFKQHQLLLYEYRVNRSESDLRRHAAKMRRALRVGASKDMHRHMTVDLEYTEQKLRAIERFTKGELND